MRIRFNVPCHTGNEQAYLEQAIQEGALSGNGPFNRRCADWIAARLGSPRVLMTSSCTHALELAALAAGVQPGDEVIMPSYTFVSTANAFALRGATIVFVDVRPDTMNIDEALIEAAITPRTKAIVVVHYAGIGCEMASILATARAHGLLVIEDAAQALMSDYRNRPLGSLGDMSAFSFHETKNYTCGEGGALAINRPDLVEAAETIQEKGTNRAAFYRGQVDKYTWVGLGSSFLMSELQAAYLLAQLEAAETILSGRMAVWEIYREGLSGHARVGDSDVPRVPPECHHNAHLFYLKLADLAERQRLIGFLDERNISSVFHYVPLHASPAGRRLGRMHGEDRWTTRESERLTRLPLYYGLSPDDAGKVVDAVRGFLDATPRRQAAGGGPPARP